MTICMLDWGRRQRELIESLEEDIDKFDEVYGDCDIELSSEMQTKIKFLWTTRSTYDEKELTLKNSVSTTEIRKLLEDYYKARLQRANDILTKSEAKDFTNLNCKNLYRNKCRYQSCRSCDECQNFEFNEHAEEQILNPPQIKEEPKEEPKEEDDDIPASSLISSRFNFDK